MQNIGMIEPHSPRWAALATSRTYVIYFNVVTTTPQTPPVFVVSRALACARGVETSPTMEGIGGPMPKRRPSSFLFELRDVLLSRPLVFFTGLGQEKTRS